MTDNDIIRMAREAGLMSVEFSAALEEMWVGQLKRFAKLIAAAEREECAQIAAWILKMPENDVSTAIRAKGQK